MLLLTLFSDFSWLLERKCKLPSTPFCWPLWPHLTPLLCALSRHQGFFCASHRTFLSFWNNLKAFHMAIFFLFQDLSSDVTFMESLSLYMLSQSSYIPQPLSQESVLISVLINFCINWLNCLIFFSLLTMCRDSLHSLCHCITTTYQECSLKVHSVHCLNLCKKTWMRTEKSEGWVRAEGFRVIFVFSRQFFLN